MERIGISGSWRIASRQNDPKVDAIKSDVRQYVTSVINNGDGIVTGGALGVDFWATDAAMKCAKYKDQVHIIIPTPLQTFLNHYKKRSEEGVIEECLFLSIKEQLTNVAENWQLVEMTYDVCTPETYYARNTEVIRSSDRLTAFVVNGSAGTMDAVEKAQIMNKPTHVISYDL